MTNSTEACATRAITVPFNGAELYVVEHNGQPFTPMKPIVESMGLTWHGQHRKLMQGYSHHENTSGRWGMVIMTIPLQGGAQEMLTMPLRKLPGWMATLEPSRIKNSDVRARVIQYQNECDDVLWQYWNDGIAINPHALYSVNPGDVLIKAEADALRQTIEGMAKKLSADTKVQGKFIMQAWSKLKSHFKVAYREIPRHELTEAISIVNRHTVEWALVDEAPKPSIATALAPEESHTKAAFDAATQAAASVQTAVFNAVLSGNDEWKYSRWLLAFVTNSKITAPAIVQKLPHDAFATSWATLTRDIAGGECLRSTPELLAMASACMHRLQQRSSSARLAA